MSTIHEIHDCFVGDTLVVTDRGETPISEIETGDYVLTSEGWRMVLQAHDIGIRETTVFNVWCKGECYCLECTPDHMVKTKKGWKAVDTLKEGDRVYTADGKTIKIDHVNRYGKAPHSVYDLTVAGNHEYFANGVLVHNSLGTI